MFYELIKQLDHETFFLYGWTDGIQRDSTWTLGDDYSSLIFN